jgi:hypothetical protein
LHLTSMRNVMHANGDLTQAVVRLEVRIIWIYWLHEWR